jgi:hypothetical protein
MPRVRDRSHPRAGAGRRYQQDCDLCDHHPGEGDGLAWEVFDERYPHGPDGWHPDFRRAPGSETWNEMAARGGHDRPPGQAARQAVRGGRLARRRHRPVMLRFLAVDLATTGQRAGSGRNASITEWRWARTRQLPRSSGAGAVQRYAHLLAASLAG